jgi:hypothetical protein
MFLFVITSISVSRITRALCKSTTVYDDSFTMIAVIPKIKLTVPPMHRHMKSNLIFDCVRLGLANTHICLKYFSSNII